MSNRSTFEKDMNELMIWDARMARAGARIGLKPFPIQYELVTDSQMVQLMPYVMMPTDYRHWSKGKQAERDKDSAKFMHIFEAVLNTNPSICYLGTTNTLEMQLNVMAHAVWGHVDFFANNQTFRETSPDTVVARFAQGKRLIDSMIEDPDWGWEGVEYILDACHALEHYCGWVPQVIETVPEQQLRDNLMESARELRRRISTEGKLSAGLKGGLERELASIEQQLKRFPIAPTGDLLGVLMNAEYNPTAPDEVRTLISIVRDRSRYFQPQGRTKFMNEGWASYWEKWLLLQPEVEIPNELRFGLIQAWTMHDRVATNWYFDPYALGLRGWDFVDKKKGFDEGEIEIKVPLLKRDEEGVLKELKKTKTVKHTKRNFDEMLRIRREYDDQRFLNEFLCEEMFENINQDALDWVRGNMKRINSILAKSGWGQQLVFEPIPLTIEEMMVIIQTWTQTAQAADQYSQFLGNPRFPIPAQTLEQMGTVLQIVMAFDADKHKARKQLVLRTGYNGVPNVKLLDTGRFTDGVWTLKHEYDETFGPLLQSECRDTLKYFRRLCNGSCRLLTWEIRTDWRGNPVGGPVPFEYFTEDGDLIKERFL